MDARVATSVPDVMVGDEVGKARLKVECCLAKTNMRDDGRHASRAACPGTILPRHQFTLHLKRKLLSGNFNVVRAKSARTNDK